MTSWSLLEIWLTLPNNRVISLHNNHQLYPIGIPFYFALRRERKFWRFFIVTISGLFLNISPVHLLWYGEMTAATPSTTETWPDWSKSYNIEKHDCHEEEATGDTVNNESSGAIGEDVVRHVLVTSSSTQYSQHQQSFFLVFVFFIKECKRRLYFSRCCKRWHF